jgi:DNA-binding response OmpR family regulator
MADHTVQKPSSPGDAVTRVLVAENDDAMGAFLAKVLETLGYAVDRVCSEGELNQYLATIGSSAFAVANSPGLIISGIYMPGKTAIDVLVKLREIVPHIPVILITSFEAPKIRENAMRLGAAAVFDKPFNIDVLKLFLKQHAPLNAGHENSSDASRRQSDAPSDQQSGPVIA